MQEYEYSPMDQDLFTLTNNYITEHNAAGIFNQINNILHYDCKLDSAAFCLIVTYCYLKMQEKTENKIIDILDYLLTHNKNYTKKQYEMLLDIQELIKGGLICD